MLKSRTDLAFEAVVLGSYVAAPTRTNTIQAKRAMRYLRHTDKKMFIMEPSLQTSCQLMWTQIGVIKREREEP